jgi:hypothetical protein
VNATYPSADAFAACAGSINSRAIGGTTYVIRASIKFLKKIFQYWYGRAAFLNQTPMNSKTFPHGNCSTSSRQQWNNIGGLARHVITLKRRRPQSGG